MATETGPLPGQMLGAIFSASPDAIIVIDDSGTIVLSSPAVTTLFGFYPEELVGESLNILVPLDRRHRHNSHLRHFFLSPNARQMGAGLELAGRQRDGEEFPIDVSLAPVVVRERNYAAAFVRDTRERRRAIDRLHAVNEITQGLLSGTGVNEILPIVTRHARLLSRSDAVWLVMTTHDDELTIIAADGVGADALLGVVLSADASRSAQVMRTGQPGTVEDLSKAENVPDPDIIRTLGPGLYVPLTANNRGSGALVFGRTRGRVQYQSIDVAFAEVFASSTAAAMEMGDVRAEIDRLSIVAEDERIARDLHDTVIQELFAVGMSLEAIRASASTPVDERIGAAVASLDRVIVEIRNTIFRLPGREMVARGLRDKMLRLSDRYRHEHGLAPRMVFRGPVDGSVPDHIAEHLLQVFSEGLSNIARHARASNVAAMVTVESNRLTFSLEDDGDGISDAPMSGNGLRNMSARAAALGGTWEIARGQSSGSIITWSVPLSPEH